MSYNYNYLFIYYCASRAGGTAQLREPTKGWQSGMPGLWCFVNDKTPPGLGLGYLRAKPAVKFNRSTAVHVYSIRIANRIARIRIAPPKKAMGFRVLASLLVSSDPPCEYALQYPPPLLVPHFSPSTTIQKSRSRKHTLKPCSPGTDVCDPSAGASDVSGTKCVVADEFPF